MVPGSGREKKRWAVTLNRSYWQRPSENYEKAFSWKVLNWKSYLHFLNLFFNWRKIALQRIGFCRTTRQVSHNHTYIISLWSPPFPASHLSRSSQSTRLGSLCCIATSYWLSILHTVVYIRQRYFLRLSHSLLLPLCPQSILHFHSFPANKFISTFFLDSIYTC